MKKSLSIGNTIIKKKKITSDPVTQYNFGISYEMGPRTSFSFVDDPRHIAFVLSRYKFCAKMLEGKKEVLEIGCGDGFGTSIVAQAVKYVFAVDIDAPLVESNKKRLAIIKNITFSTFDLTKERLNKVFDAAYSIDVQEHIILSKEDTFMRNICKSLRDNGIYIIGTPNITAYKFASISSKGYHWNLKSHETLRKLLQKYFENVFMFSMNDEMVHTGFGPMAHYLFGMGVGKK